jgi:hypothetical protein
MARRSEGGWKTSWWKRVERKGIERRGMEEAPENGKESSHSAHANGMNELTTHKNLPLFCYNDQIYPKHNKLYIIIQHWNKNPNFKTLSLVCDSPPSLF